MIDGNPRNMAEDHTHLHLQGIVGAVEAVQRQVPQIVPVEGSPDIGQKILQEVLHMVHSLFLRNFQTTYENFRKPEKNKEKQKKANEKTRRITFPQTETP